MSKRGRVWKETLGHTLGPGFLAVTPSPALTPLPFLKVQPPESFLTRVWAPREPRGRLQEGSHRGSGEHPALFIWSLPVCWSNVARWGGNRERQSRVLPALSTGKNERLLASGAEPTALCVLTARGQRFLEGPG